MLLHGKHINTLLRTRIHDSKSAGTLAESAPEIDVTSCKLIVYLLTPQPYVRYIEDSRRQQQPSAFNRFSVWAKAGRGYGRFFM